MTSVEPSVTDLDAADLEELLATLRWSREDLDPSLPPRLGYAGAYHPVLAAATRERLADLVNFFEIATTAYEQMEKLPTPAVLKLAKLGDKAFKLLGIGAAA